MIGVDTNVFLRFAIDDDPGQHRAAVSLLRAASSNEPVVVQPIVWIEAEWVLRTRYGLDRGAIADRLAVTLAAEQIRVPEQEACAAALADYRSGTADLAECLIARLNAAHGCSTTYTFDKRAARLADVSRLTE